MIRSVDAPFRLFPSRRGWRDWLIRNHATSKGIWLAYYKKRSGKTSVTYEEALEEALCFGWIDSTIARIDDERYRQKFTPRREKSIWSAANKSRVAKLLLAGRIEAPGLAKIEAAKKNGSWARPSDPDRVGRSAEPPPDLLDTLAQNPRAAAAFDGRPKSEKRLWALWVLSAKKPKTRARRVAETVSRVLAGRRPGF